MKKLLPLACVCILSSGCLTSYYNNKVTETLPDKRIITRETTWRGNSAFSTSALKGLVVDGTTKTTTNGLKITGATTDPNSESITASGAALGELIGSAASKVIKP